MSESDNGNSADATDVERLCRAYLAAVEAGDLDALRALFADDATATSPISGPQPAADFYAHALSITHDRRLVLKAVFAGVTDPARAAVHFAYTRTVGDNEPATIECIDVFELTADRRRFAAVTIVYDTAPVRADFAAPKDGGSSG